MKNNCKFLGVYGGIYHSKTSASCTTGTFYSHYLRQSKMIEWIILYVVHICSTFCLRAFAATRIPPTMITMIAM